jgi:cephalosporin hydroxylase
MNVLRKLIKLPQEKVNFNIESVYQGHHKITYRGIPALKCPFDYVIYQMIIMKLQPDVIIEIGTNRGGSALYLADLMNIINHGVVHTIDIKYPSEIVLEHPRIRAFNDGWQGYDISEIKNFSKIMVIDDASHIYEDTLAAIIKFAPLVSKDSYLIVEDGIISELGFSEEYHGGPLKAINEFLEIHKDFIIDNQWCNMFGKNATFNVNGYLKKIA